jgi:hypothetical protein
MRGRTFIVCVGLAGALGMARVASGQDTSSTPRDSKVTFTLYPLLVRAPIMGATVDLPSVPPPPNGGGGADDTSGSTDFSLNSLWMAGIAVDSNRWFAETFGLYAALSASRATPLASVDSNTYLFNGRGGVRLFGGLSATAGFRRISADLDVKLAHPSDGTTLEGRAKPVLWDPLIGLDWRGQATKRLWLSANAQGGGFGVGTDVDVSAEGYANWRLMPHLELRVGYTMVHLKMTVAHVTVASLDRTLIMRQTLHGPEFGIGIPF